MPHPSIICTCVQYQSIHQKPRVNPGGGDFKGLGSPTPLSNTIVMKIDVILTVNSVFFCAYESVSTVQAPLFSDDK